ncbi:Zn-ribbon domain-containing OB-fold protein [Trujillonella endophytica]|uniref:DNA-binding protein n=1 Tax=Trujillonella endophytica TaxID=673521 RepID=A0A1H8T680_9ACTN|nr:OB-fold domain-containing protein [Trujillella endophytica]SEO86437.1 hypothetical protein SAMN05660991_02097 [Trujillella endophytica]
MSDFLTPKATPETAPFWAGAAEGVLRIQQCDACGRHYFYPRRFCRYCHSTDVRWTTVSGRARLDSYTINHRPLRGTESLSPVIALVQLEEGPRMLTNIVGVEPDPANLVLDMPLTVDFEPRGDMTVPVFRPASTGSAEGTR